MCIWKEDLNICFSQNRLHPWLLRKLIGIETLKKFSYIKSDNGIDFPQKKGESFLVAIAMKKLSWKPHIKDKEWRQACYVIIAFHTASLSWLN